MQWDKVTWEAVDDDDIDIQLPSDKNELLVSLEQQRIRMFYLEYYYWDGEDWNEDE